jgi:hypothetical protein
MRDFNSTVARAVQRYQMGYPGGNVWGRRYSSEHLPANEDIEEWFFYTVLQAVNDGLVDDIRDYPGYNCFEDAIAGTTRKYRVIRWKEYNDARRWRPNISIEDFTEVCTLKFQRLPGYEELSQPEYEAMMRAKLRDRTRAIVERRAGRPCFGFDNLKRVTPGSRPKKTKKSVRHDHRPRVLSKDPVRRGTSREWCFGIQRDYRGCSKRYRAGAANVIFPPGTYKPPLFTQANCDVLCRCK